MEKHIEHLGFGARDKITGFAGIISSISFDVTGCIQAYLKPSYNHAHSNQPDGQWFDLTCLEFTSDRVMENPFGKDERIDRGEQGSQNKSLKINSK